MKPSTPLMDKSPAVAPKPEVRPAASPAPTPRTLPICLALALTSGGLLWACYHPLAWGWLGWVALVPVLLLARSTARPRHIYWSAYLGGSLFFWTVLQWMRVADYRMYGTWAMLAVYCSFYFPLGIYLIRRFDRHTRVPLALSVPIVWTALEYFRAVFGTGFGWYLLGYTQHDYLPLIQVADLGGVFLVSFVVAAVNGFLCDVLYQIPAVRSVFRLAEPSAVQRSLGWDWGLLGFDALGTWRRGLPYEATALLAVLAGTYAYGVYRMGEYQPRSGPVVALLQGNLDQRIRNQAATARDAQQRIAQEYAALNQHALSHYPSPSLLIWPETSFPVLWAEVDRDLPIDQVSEQWRDLAGGSLNAVRDWARGTKTNHLLGVNTVYLGADRKERNYNSALLLTDQGVVAGRYDKMHRVPFGEYVPLRDWLPFMDWFAPYEHDYSIRPGEKFTRFEVKDGEKTFRFGVLICYEDTDHLLGTHYAVHEADGPPVDFLVNISNDGWFDGTSEHEEHLAVSRLRAVESRRALARAVNMGVSAVIDGNGRVLRPKLLNAEPMAQGKQTLPVWGIAERVAGELPQRDWHQYKQVAGVLVATIPLDRRESFYAAFGDWLPGVCWVTIIGVCVWAYVRRHRRPAAQVG